MLVSFLHPKQQKHYNYSKSELIHPEFGAILEVVFSPFTNSKKGVYKGYVLIDKKTNAIVQLHYEYDLSRIKRVNDVVSISKSDFEYSGFLVRETGFSSTTTYRKSTDIWILEKVEAMYSFDMTDQALDKTYHQRL